jgi:hypothetical protein
MIVPFDGLELVYQSLRTRAATYAQISARQCAGLQIGPRSFQTQAAIGSSSTIRALQVCVSTVSIVCATYVLLYDPSKKGGIALRPIATASTNDADGADGIFGTRAHPYHSGPAPALTRERDLNTHRPEECLRPSQAIGECARVFCPRAARRDLIAGILLPSKY